MVNTRVRRSWRVRGGVRHSSGALAERWELVEIRGGRKRVVDAFHMLLSALPVVDPADRLTP